MIDFPQRLCEGYRAFHLSRLPAEQNRYRELAERGQSPDTMVIGCCDSRVSPEVIFDARPGELFVVRNIANLIPPYEPDMAHHGVSAALEFAVLVLNVSHIVILGHARCGGIRAVADGNADKIGEFMGRWLALVTSAAVALGPRDDAPETYHTRLEQASLIASLGNLMTFPFVRSRCEAGGLKLHGAYFDVASGALSVLDRETGRFSAIP